MKTIVCSFSGGRSSAIMARLLQTAKVYDQFQKVYVFSNSGKEREETLRFVHECDTRWNLGVVWLEAIINPEKGKGTRHKIVSFETAIRNTDEGKSGHPFVDMVDKYGIPSNAFPHCTRELKLAPIKSYLKSIGLKDYVTAIGVRPDEPKRIKPKPNIIYPLVEFDITEPLVRRYWERQTFDLGLKDYQGNCDLCFKKSLRKRLTIIRENPEVADFWEKLEGARTVNGVRHDQLVFDRYKLSIKTLRQLAEDPKLILAIDKRDARLAYEAANPELYEPLQDLNLDSETSCLCESGFTPQNYRTESKEEAKRLWNTRAEPRPAEAPEHGRALYNEWVCNSNNGISERQCSWMELSEDQRALWNRKAKAPEPVSDRHREAAADFVKTFGWISEESREAVRLWLAKHFPEK